MPKDNKNAKMREQVNRLGCPDVAMLNREIAWHERREAYRRLAVGILVSLLAASAAMILITNLWITVLQIDGSSMSPLLALDEVVLVVKGSSPRQNDIIAFYYNNKLHIKRVVGIAGDTISIDSSGKVAVNDTPLEETYIAEPSLEPCDIGFPYLVPSGTVFVMGDNRKDSMDSRDSRFGCIPKEQLIGTVVLRVWPFRKIGSIA